MRQCIWRIWLRVESGFWEAFHLSGHWLLTFLNVLASTSPLLLPLKEAVFQVSSPWLLTSLITWLKTLVTISQSKHYPSSLKISHVLGCFYSYLRGIMKIQLWDYSEFWKQLLQNTVLINNHSPDCIHCKKNFKNMNSITTPMLSTVEYYIFIQIWILSHRDSTKYACHLGYSIVFLFKKFMKDEIDWKSVVDLVVWFWVSLCVQASELAKKSDAISLAI